MSGPCKPRRGVLSWCSRMPPEEASAAATKKPVTPDPSLDSHSQSYTHSHSRNHSRLDNATHENLTNIPSSATPPPPLIQYSRPTRKTTLSNGDGDQPNQPNQPNQTNRSHARRASRPVLRPFGCALMSGVVKNNSSFAVFSLLFLLGLIVSSRSVYNLPRLAMTRDLEEVKEYLNQQERSMHRDLEELVEKASSKAEEFQRREMKEMMEAHSLSFGREMGLVKSDLAKMGSSLKRLESQELLSTEDVMRLINEAIQSTPKDHPFGHNIEHQNDHNDNNNDNDDGGGGYMKEGERLSLDSVREAAKRIVQMEIARHSSDGIGKVDYALGSGGGRVVGHSKVFHVGSVISRGALWRLNPLRVVGNSLLSWRLSSQGQKRKLDHIYNINVDDQSMANKVIEPSFGEPGQCLPLAGSNAYVDIALRSPIFLDAITLEHVSKDVAYDISSAPKEFQIYGIKYSLNKEESNGDRELNSYVHKEWEFLGEFTYDIYNINAIQTFKPLIDIENLYYLIRLHVISNYGSPSHTCIYRLRVHGSDHKT